MGEGPGLGPGPPRGVWGLHGGAARGGFPGERQMRRFRRFFEQEIGTKRSFTELFGKILSFCLLIGESS